MLNVPFYYIKLNVGSDLLDRVLCSTVVVTLEKLSLYICMPKGYSDRMKAYNRLVDLNRARLSGSRNLLQQRTLGTLYYIVV